MKILYVTTIGGTMNFFRTFIEGLVREGHTVDIACNNSTSKVANFYYRLGCKVHFIPTSRSPLCKDNLNAIKQLEKLVDENEYDIVHCHTPVAAMCTRLACRKARKRGTKVFYTAHGFHFYKGAPLTNWLLYYPVEKLCAFFTDVLITINQEDYALAKKHMPAKRVEYVPGVGIDVEKFSKAEVDRAAKRRELGIPEDAVLLLSVGELNENKNHETVMRAIADMDVYYIIAGDGYFQEHLQEVIHELGMTERVKLLGFRKDVIELYHAADVFCFPSIREGLGLSAIEAMACGLPIVAADNRGTREFCQEGVTGCICNPHKAEEFTVAIKTILSDAVLRKKISKANCQAASRFDATSVNKQMTELYFERVKHYEHSI